ncbi:MAG: dipeptidase [Spirochaetia bacterium]|jgi:membrane dipeptidase|nr:dipeptidase [Spirochaetia bacterium]
MKQLVTLHSDTIFKIEQEGGNLRSNDFDLSLEKLSGFKSLTTFAFFVPLDKHPDAFSYLEKLHGIQKREFDENKDLISLISDRAGYESKQTSAILSIEEGAVYKGDVANVKKFYDWGVRISTLTWNFENDLAYPTSTDRNVMSMGLKDKGFEIAEALEACKVLIDVSHLNDKGIADLLERAKRPVIASHSNCRSLCNHQRNLTDEQIKGIADTGGVVGINFFPPFVEEGPEPKATYQGLAKHILHLYQVGGEDILAIGPDYDGIDGSYEPKDISGMPDFYTYLHEHTDLSMSVLDKLFYGNALRVLF